MVVSHTGFDLGWVSTRKRVRGAVAGGPTTTDESSPACLPNRSLSNRPTDRRRAARHTFVAMHPGGLCALAARGALERELDRAAPPTTGIAYVRTRVVDRGRRHHVPSLLCHAACPAAHTHGPLGAPASGKAKQKQNKAILVVGSFSFKAAAAHCWSSFLCVLLAGPGRRSAPGVTRTPPPAAAAYAHKW